MARVHLQRAGLLEQEARPLISFELHYPGNDPCRQHHGVPRPAAVRRAYRMLAVELRDREGDHLGRDARLVAEGDDRRVDIAERDEARAQGRGLPGRPVVAYHGLRPAKIDARADLIRTRAEHHHYAIQPGHRVERVLEQRPPVELRELLGPAEARALPGGEHHAGDHDISPSSRSASSASDAIELPERKWSTNGSAACIPRVSGS